MTIRPYRRSDARDLHAAARETIDEVQPWMPWCHPDYEIDEARAWIEATIAGRKEESLYDFAIFADNQYAGGCEINNINRVDGVANLGYWVRRSLGGRGIAAAAVRQVIEWTFKNTNLNRIEILAARENTRSRRVAEKAGATRDATLKKRLLVNGRPVDAVLYSVLRPD